MAFAIVQQSETNTTYEVVINGEVVTYTVTKGKGEDFLARTLRYEAMLLDACDIWTCYYHSVPN